MQLQANILRKSVLVVLEHIVEVYRNFYVAELFHSELLDFSFHTV